jgi:hypothetical protein
MIVHSFVTMLGVVTNSTTLSQVRTASDTGYGKSARDNPGGTPDD